MIQFIIVFFAACTAAAALGTGFFTHPGHFSFGWMTGFFPPHRGYSAYIACALIFLAPHRWLRGLGMAAAGLSAARAAWIGVIAGWAWGRPRRVALASILAGLALVGGNMVKDYGARGDVARVQIWKLAWSQAVKHPHGVGEGRFIGAIGGYAVTKAHSDLMQVLVERGFLTAISAMGLIAAGLWLAPASPWKDLVVCLTTQSLVDNRLHHPACAALYAVVWACALAELRKDDADDR